MSEASKILRMQDGDCALIFREGGAVDLLHPVMKTPGERSAYWLSEAAITAIGVKLALGNDDWREKLAVRAKHWIEKQLEEVEKENG